MELRQRICTQNKPAKRTAQTTVHGAFCKFKTYNQLLVVRNKCFCTAFRQVSRLKDHRIRHLPSFPVIYRPQLPNYGDEFAQDLHLFPFSSEQIICIALTPDCFIFNLHYHSPILQLCQYIVREIFIFKISRCRPYQTQDSGQRINALHSALISSSRILQFRWNGSIRSVSSKNASASFFFPSPRFPSPIT